MIDALANHLWQSTLFAAGAALLTVAFRRNRAQVRYWLWFSASFKFLVPFALLTSLGSQLPWGPEARKITTQIPPAVSLTVGEIAEPIADALPPAGSNRDWAPAGIAIIWACGFGAVMLIRFRGWLSIRAAVRSSTPVALPALIEIRSSPGLLEPGVVGLFRPILLVPADIEQRLTPPQLEAVLAHELCHVRRRDNLFASLHMICEAIFWFHPVVWWIGARLLEERERACDEEVLKLRRDPQVYAEGILNVCKLYAESPLKCVSGVTGSNIKKRIEAIMENRIAIRLNFAKKAALAAAGLAAVAVPIAVGVLKAPMGRAQSAAVPKFYAASIRGCSEQNGLKKGAGYSLVSGTLNTGCVNLADENNLGLIQRAYVRFAGGQPHWPGIVPIEGGPAWIRSELFEISARAEGSPAPEMMEGPMMQALLEDRFKLKIRRETRDVPVYALTVAPGGHRLNAFKEGSCVAMPLRIPVPALPPGQQYCKVRIGIQPPAVDAQGSTLAEFSRLLDRMLDRPVIDKTGIAGKFNIHLEFGDGATFAAIEQLGLKLEATEGAREFLVVDHVERPVAP